MPPPDRIPGLKPRKLPRATTMVLLWTLAVVASLTWNIIQIRQSAQEQARSSARASIDKDLNYRSLIADLGGVYARIGAGVEPNPFLAHVPERDVVTAGGTRLTLVNSSYFMRLVHDRELDLAGPGLRGHATSLHPLRAANAPDPWEWAGLEAFAQGAEEWSGITEGPDGPAYRLMRPRLTTAACLECHGHQGYREGDVLGGISVSVPLTPLYAQARERALVFGLGHGFLWLLGIGGLTLGYHVLTGKEKDLARAAFYDPLTGLPNRTLFMDRLEQALLRAQRHNERGALFYLDLDRFKHINDSLGHSIGDGLLHQVANSLRRLLREEDTVARLGGDEFVVLLTGLGADADAAFLHAQTLAAKLLQHLCRRYPVDGHELYVSISVGITLFPENAHTTQDLLKQADAAMYEAKDRGGNAFHFYVPSLQAAADQRLQMENDLRSALEDGELVLYYQPQVDSERNGVLGAEALLRWERPGHGLTHPDDFIHIAEETGLILAIGEWVIREACRQIRAWDAESSRPPLPQVSVNVSPRQFRQPDFVQRVTGILAETGVSPGRIVLELTERILLEDMEGAAERIRELQASGVRFCIDDFGMGYSSLAYLKNLPVEALKIDRSFVRDVPTDPNDVAIVETIIAMAWRFGLKVIAEGVETEEQLNFLAARGCDAYQGHLHSQAMPAGEFERYLS